jgi:D-alanine transaminase
VPEVAYVQDRFVALQEATVSIDDRGFLFGDGVYEVLRTYRGRPFQLEAHLRRLQRSAEAIALRMRRSGADLSALIEEGLRRGAWTESKIYLQFTRGAAPRDHAFPVDAVPTLVMTIREMQPLDPAVRASGVAAMTMDDLRWGRCDIKSVNLLPNVLARQRAKDAGAFEAIFLRDGVVTEGSVSNVLIVREGRIATAAEGPAILSGVTRHVVLELARKEGLVVEERAVTVDELRRADEVLLTGTTVEILPIVAIDGRPVGRGTPGPVGSMLQHRFTAIAG